MKVTWQKHKEYLNHGWWATLWPSICVIVFHLAAELSVSMRSGWLLIAEVKSRFDPSNGGADPKKFIKAVCELGFVSALKVYYFSVANYPFLSCC